MITKKPVLVIGGNGFVGSALVKKLHEHGHEVIGMSRSKENKLTTLSSVEWINASINDDDALNAVLPKVDVCFHLASSTVPQTANLNPRNDIATNLIGTVGLLEAAVEAKLKRLIFVSSGGTVYGPPQIVPIPEEHKLEPTTSYGITKAAIEKFIHLFQQRDGLDSIILRLSNPYGPGQKTHGTQGVIAAFAYRILNDLPIELWGDGSTIRDFIYIDDAINGLMASIDYSGTHRVFNIGSGIGISISEIIKKIEDACNKKANIHVKGKIKLDVDKNILDIKKAATELKYQPETSIEDGIKKTIEHMKSLRS